MSLLPGLGPTLSTRLKAAGFTDIRELVADADVLPRGVRHLAVDRARDLLEKLESADVKGLCELVPKSDHWRVAAALPHRSLFLDIETTGLSHAYHEVTLVGTLANGQFRVAVGPLGAKQLAELAERFVEYPLLVTFNGIRFDARFLRANYPSLPVPHGHADLMYLARRVGLAGRLKDLERTLSIGRDSGDLPDLTGSDAPALWYRYIRGDADSLERLVHYNFQDVANLAQVLDVLAGKLLGHDLRQEPRPSYSAWRSGPDGRSTFATLPAVSGAPRVTLPQLELKEPYVVVGIDLTGSESRPSGWAMLKGASATTARVASDEELILRTLGARPDLVSIDAPLSLPAGRTGVLDSDPERSRGIVRVAERVLWSRGVSAYPALIKSMQQLTARGIALASTLRRQGVPVIESYPGALQDILGMPRKGVSLEELKWSLSAYGLNGGDWQASAVTHDEVDAMSSAIAGQFFLAGRFEAIGSREENFMIIPSMVKRDSSVELVVGVSGRTAAGKSTVAQMLESAGFLTISMSAVVRSMMLTASEPIDRSRLQEAGERIRSDGRQRELSLETSRVVMRHKRAVIDGVRFLEDFATFKEEFGLRYLHIHVEADHLVRRRRFLDRIGERGQTRLSQSFERANASSTESEANLLEQVAHVVLSNNGTLEDLRRSVLGVVGKRVTECQ
ncbi:MAG: DUF429 domain-containing protein [Microcella sp.]|uniref:ribonuclease H-like domain-containing protein n=1 Tax=Microcella sp. TaxID=1913979 RepID=UPI0024CB8AFF|nr:ribonuclease H-like domain-containing protein [Microcella sp.]UYN84744.1 MAG: DUF429 domain-containing protein [Microcella sp.]